MELNTWLVLKCLFNQARLTQTAYFELNFAIFICDIVLFYVTIFGLGTFINQDSIASVALAFLLAVYFY